MKDRLRAKPHLRERGRRRCTAWRTCPSPRRPGYPTTTRPAAPTSPPRSPGTRASLARRPRPGPRDRQPGLRQDGRVRDERARPPGRSGRGARRPSTAMSANETAPAASPSAPRTRFRRRPGTATGTGSAELSPSRMNLHAPGVLAQAAVERREVRKVPARIRPSVVATGRHLLILAVPRHGGYSRASVPLGVLPLSLARGRAPLAADPEEDGLALAGCAAARRGG